MAPPDDDLQVGFSFENTEGLRKIKSTGQAVDDLLKSFREAGQAVQQFANQENKGAATILEDQARVKKAFADLKVAMFEAERSGVSLNDELQETLRGFRLYAAQAAESLKRVQKEERDLASVRKVLDQEVNARRREQLKAYEVLVKESGEKIREIETRRAELLKQQARAITEAQAKGLDDLQARRRRLAEEERAQIDAVYNKYLATTSKRLQQEARIAQITKQQGEAAGQIARRQLALEDQLLARRRELARAAAQSARAVEDSGKRQISTLDRIGITLRRLITAWVFYRSISIVRETIEAARAFERIESTLRATTGSAEGTAEAMDYVRGLAQKLAVDLEVTAKEYAKFTASIEGSSLNLNEQRFIFESVAKTARVLGLSMDDLQGVYVAFSQSISKGTVFQEELRQQLGDRLPGAVPKFSQAIGVATSELNKLIQKGLIPADQAMLLFARRLNEFSDPALGAALATLDAQIVRLKNSTFQLKAAFGEGIKEGVGDSFETLGNDVSDLDDAVKSLGYTVGTLAAPATFIAKIYGFTFKEIAKDLRIIVAGYEYLRAKVTGSQADIVRAQEGWAEALKANEEQAKSLLETFGLIPERTKDAFEFARVESGAFEEAIQKLNRAIGKDQAFALEEAKKKFLDYISKLEEGNRKIIAQGDATEDSFRKIGDAGIFTGQQIEEVRKKGKTLLAQFELFGRVPPEIRKIADTWNIVTDATKEHNDKVETLYKNYRKTLFNFREDLDLYAEALQRTIEEQIKNGNISAETLTKIKDELIELARGYRDMGKEGSATWKALQEAAERLGISISSLTETTKEHTKAEKEQAKEFKAQKKEIDDLIDSLRTLADERKKASEEATKSAEESAARIAELEGKGIIDPSELEELNRLKEEQFAKERKAKDAAEEAYFAATDLAEAERQVGENATFASQGLDVSTASLFSHRDALDAATASAEKFNSTRGGPRGGDGAAQQIDDLGQAIKETGELIDGGFLPQVKKSTDVLDQLSPTLDYTGKAAQFLADEILRNQEETEPWVAQLADANEKLDEMRKLGYDIGNWDLGGAWRESAADQRVWVEETAYNAEKAAKNVLDGFVGPVTEKIPLITNEAAKASDSLVQIGEDGKKSLVSVEDGVDGVNQSLIDTVHQIDDTIEKLGRIDEFTRMWGVSLDGVKTLMVALNEEADRLLNKLAQIEGAEAPQQGAPN